jgi:hypothetical protein
MNPVCIVAVVWAVLLSALFPLSALASPDLSFRAEQADFFSSAFAPANASACAVEESLFDSSSSRFGVSMPIFFHGADLEVGSFPAV